MKDQVSLTAPHPSLPSRARGRVAWLGVGALSLLVVVGATWALGRNDVAPSPPAASVHPLEDSALDDHPSAAIQPDGAPHRAEASAGDAHTKDGHAEDDHAEDDHAEDDHAEDDHAEDDHAVDDHAVDDHAHEQEAHGEEGDPHAAAASVSPRTKQVVLGGFAGINTLAILAAAILRRRSPIRLPKHLQRQVQGK